MMKTRRKRGIRVAGGGFECGGMARMQTLLTDVPR